MPGTGSAMTARLGLSSARGRATSSRSPAATRSDLTAGRWFSLTLPAVARSAALVRDSPNSRAMAASTRSPSSPSGTSSVRASGAIGGRLVATGVPGPVHAAAGHREEPDEDRGTDDGDVGDVADEPAVVVEEVDDVPLPEPGLPDDPVGEVAQRAAEEEAQGPRPASGPQPPADPDHDDEDDHGDDGQQPGVAGPDRERRTRVADEVEPQERPDEVARQRVGELVDRPPLGQLV